MTFFVFHAGVASTLHAAPERGWHCLGGGGQRTTVDFFSACYLQTPPTVTYDKPTTNCGGLDHRNVYPHLFMNIVDTYHSQGSKSRTRTASTNGPPSSWRYGAPTPRQCISPGPNLAASLFTVSTTPTSKTSLEQSVGLTETVRMK